MTRRHEGFVAGMGGWRLKAQGREKGDLTVDESRSEGIDAVEDNETCE
jgi:hypothetical protein